MSPLLETLLTTFVVIMTAMLALWATSTFLRDASIVDAFWGAGFVLAAWVAWSLNAPAATRVLLLTGLTTAWGLRLSLFLLCRKHGHGEDHRYATMRSRHGPRFAWVSLFTVFFLQGAILWFISLPILVAAAHNRDDGLDWPEAAGAALWLIGIFFEATGDWQLARFKSDPNNFGRVMDRGLWRFTRHPNYFGDFCVWWGLYLISIGGGAGWTLASPLLMSLLLLRVSGVTLLESTIAERRPDYAAYQSRTNAFFPGPSREE